MSQPFGHNPPRLSWLGGKTFQHSGNTRKNRPGRKPEHTAALVDNSLGVLARGEFDKRLAGPVLEFK
jgi:hypothetical protein